MYFIYKRDGRSAQEVDTLTIYVIIAAVVGARLGHVLFYDSSNFSVIQYEFLQSGRVGWQATARALACSLRYIFLLAK